ncbi:GNAT family N-acetyltransferase [Bradyrhizobium sp. CCGUVB1N3]|uniref:GNAT family N-acetyltransferase n=1 Tax=Bradyrhizobium sp. CCGUVB1N3 TaxID=2949629 RepID=UPI0020B2E51A|nr:GNAT family N-acetyltransferase [Bradyrhizobium sp. CCGUVB1N3]MCP3477520.1 GNAT family N-acetyltransferase [Bradyrhizobium sp. CCGUVB1N3]
MQSHWRRAEPSDLPAINAIATAVHPDLPERGDVLAEKMSLFPEGCRVLIAGDDVFGYGIAHPWTLHQIPPLDDFLQRLPPAPDCLYVHDVAVMPASRGSRVATSYIETLARLARASGIEHLALVSVYDTSPFWARHDFRVIAPDAALRTKLVSYGDGARYMVRNLAESRLREA